MPSFDAIRPYNDKDVPAVMSRLLCNAEFHQAAAKFFLPKTSRQLPGLSVLVVRHLLKRRLGHLRTVSDIQQMMEGYMARLIRQTIVELSVEGLETLDPDIPHLFISNHRDIVMDTGIMNYLLRSAGHPTSRIAVGDNLLTHDYAADLMRLNKSFVVERSSSGRKAMFASLSRTSNYIRTSLERGHSVWIAQRQGRAKNGIDLTDPALVKMLGLAYRKELKTFTDFSHHVDIVPVSVCYELDPCDLNKANELFVTERDGAYQKSRDEDMRSIVQGMVGFKGRVHLKFGESLKGDYPDADSLALALDRRIVSGLKVFPTHVEAARLMGIDSLPETVSTVAEVTSRFTERVAACAESQRPYLLNQYANLIRNRQNFGL